MLLARAWVVTNSSSIKGRTGAKMVLDVKFVNQRNQMKKRRSSPLPFSDGNRCTTHSTPAPPKKQANSPLPHPYSLVIVRHVVNDLRPGLVSPVRDHEVSKDRRSVEPWGHFPGLKQPEIGRLPGIDYTGVSVARKRLVQLLKKG